MAMDRRSTLSIYKCNARRKDVVVTVTVTATATATVAPKTMRMRMKMRPMMMMMMMLAVFSVPVAFSATTTAFAPFIPCNGIRSKSKTARSMAEHHGDSQQQRHIPPFDLDQVFQYLDPLKKFPSDELKENINDSKRKHFYNNGGQFALTPSSSSFPDTGPATLSKARDGYAFLLPSSTSKEGEELSHFESHRQELGWYAEDNVGGVSIDCPPIHYADQDYFSLENLVWKGPRENADVGDPEDSSRPLAKDVETAADIDGTLVDSISCGSWFCTRGGWPSKTPRITTEIFHVFQGFGCLTDLDGKRNYFGPGDTVILPKGWSGRWDIAQDIHKVRSYFLF